MHWLITEFDSLDPFIQGVSLVSITALVIAWALAPVGRR